RRLYRCTIATPRNLEIKQSGDTDMKKFLVSLLVFLFAIAVQAQKPSSMTIGPKRGSLVIVGGGRIPPSISGKFIALAGGPDANFVYIPTAGEDQTLNRQTGDESPKLFGLKNITVLHTRDRNEANTEKFAAPLRKANGVWFGGGRQWRLVDSYLDTLVHKELLAVLNRGGGLRGYSSPGPIPGFLPLRGRPRGHQTQCVTSFE